MTASEVVAWEGVIFLGIVTIGTAVVVGVLIIEAIKGAGK